MLSSIKWKPEVDRKSDKFDSPLWTITLAAAEKPG